MFIARVRLPPAPRLRVVAAVPPIFMVVAVPFAILNVAAVVVISPPFKAKSPLVVMLPYVST